MDTCGDNGENKTTPLSVSSLLLAGLVHVVVYCQLIINYTKLLEKSISINHLSLFILVRENERGGGQVIESNLIGRPGGDGGYSTRRWWWRMLPADGSVTVGADAVGPNHHPYGIRSPYCLLSRRTRLASVQRCPYTISLRLYFTLCYF